ncbi:MAG TPA: serine/threonine-protein kinase, partial [Steroidobacteraceae bacterium]|nr:serine/threonine-protein kinase [Steroidobacteraceae bacterium]
MNLSPNSWRKISEWLETAMDMDARDRDAWIESLSSTLSGDDHSLLEPLKKLLAQEAKVETHDILSATPDIAGALIAEKHAPSSATDLNAGVEVGGYRLVRELGHGGMGSVWMAEQIDGRLQRIVALKLPYAGPQRRELAKRFLQERDILAKLEHPNIARLYDADAANTARPFLVMEYVDGLPIDEYCRAKELSVKERLALFRQVFKAVHYAHIRLVIHRDLKPSNILVTAEGVVRLLDFGIAKVLAEGADASLTEIGSVVLTPNYASPEQITGDELTTTSDVYALGVVLYELLTGARPYQPKTEGRRALEDAIMLADVAMASDAALNSQGEPNAKQAAKDLRGDLDTILLKAMKKRPEERYPTAAAFAEDIDRYLRGEPVLAQADSALYRMRRFAGRNRLAVGAALAVVASLALGLSLALWQLHTTRVAQKRAEDVKEFIASIFRSADPFFTGNRSMSAVDLLALARERIDRELQDQPESAMELLNIVGESQLNLSENVAARATLEKAVALGKQVLPKGDLLTAQAQAKLGSAFASDRDHESAKAHFAESISVLRSGGPKAARALSNALQFQAGIDADEGNDDTALALSKEAYEVVHAALGPLDSETILSKRNWAQHMLMAGRVKEAIPLAKEAFDDAKAVANHGERNALLLSTESLYGRLLVETDEVIPGIEHLNSALELAEKIYGPKSPSEVAYLSYLMRAQLRLGDFEGMIVSASRSYEAADNERVAARPLTTLGDVYVRARKLNEAESISRRAVEAEKKYDTGKGSWLPVAQATHATALLYLGRVVEAQTLLKDNAALVGDSKDGTTMPHWAAVGQAHGMVGEWEKSEQGYRTLLERTIDSVASARWRTVAWNGIGLAQLELGKTQAAMTSLRDADKFARIAYVSMTPPQADVLVSLTRAHLIQKSAPDALPLIEEADRFWQTYDARSRWGGEAAYWH